MTPTLPRQITIGGQKVRIVVVPNLEEWGSYHHDKKEIHLASRCLAKASDLRSTLRHEIMHASMSISGVAFMEAFEEESVVRCFDEIFFPCWDKLKDKYKL